MSQRDSGYARIERDNYETPKWVTNALIPHVAQRLRHPCLVQAKIWEPACGSCKMVEALAPLGRVDFTDIDSGMDFLKTEIKGYDAIITNPPYALAEEFIDHALGLTEPDGLVAMLLRCDFDSAKTRKDFFVGPRGPFAKKIILTSRIKWFEGSKGSPSFNHAWFIWDWRHQGPPTLAYAP